MANGDPTVPTEGAWRELRRMYYQQRRQLTNLTRRLATFSASPDRGDRLAPPRVRFKNTASEAAPAWGVMRITTATAGDTHLSCAKPDSTYRWFYLVNGSRDVPASGYGYGHFLTAETFAQRRQYVLYDTGATPAVGEEWGPKDDSWLVWEHRPGFLIVGATAGTGSTSRVVAVQQPPGEILVKNSTGSAIGAAASGTATLFGGVAGSEASLGLTVTAYNRSSTSWADTKYGTADLINGQVYVSPQQT